ncbi:MAG: hypothetical protein MJ132_09040, partial [Clostridia bacterium]|nr:hypothetical protein [Clostridia bacterium]
MKQCPDKKAGHYFIKELTAYVLLLLLFLFTSFQEDNQQNNKGYNHQNNDDNENVKPHGKTDRNGFTSF